DVAEVWVGDEVYALTPFDRDGVAAEYAAVTGSLLAPKPASLSHVESAAVPLPALTASQGLFVHGRLAAGERVLVHGAVGGVGQFATQLGRWRGAHVIATASPGAVHAAGVLGAHEVVDGRSGQFIDELQAVDLIFDPGRRANTARSSSRWRATGAPHEADSEPRRSAITPSAAGARGYRHHWARVSSS